jgi:hypothetical protein
MSDADNNPAAPAAQFNQGAGPAAGAQTTIQQHLQLNLTKERLWQLVRQ